MVQVSQKDWVFSLDMIITKDKEQRGVDTAPRILDQLPGRVFLKRSDRARER